MKYKTIQNFERLNISRRNQSTDHIEISDEERHAPKPSKKKDLFSPVSHQKSRKQTQPSVKNFFNKETSKNSKVKSQNNSKVSKNAKHSAKLSPKIGKKEMEKMFDNDETFVDNALEIHRKTAPKITPPRNTKQRPKSPDLAISGSFLKFFLSCLNN